MRHNSVSGNGDGIFVGFAEGSQDNVVADNHSYNSTNGAITLEVDVSEAGLQLARR